MAPYSISGKGREDSQKKLMFELSWRRSNTYPDDKNEQWIFKSKWTDEENYPFFLSLEL